LSVSARWVLRAAVVVSLARPHPDAFDLVNTRCSMSTRSISTLGRIAIEMANIATVSTASVTATRRAPVLCPNRRMRTAIGARAIPPQKSPCSSFPRRTSGGGLAGMLRG
jgi:hypothetical protein